MSFINFYKSYIAHKKQYFKSIKAMKTQSFFNIQFLGLINDNGTEKSVKYEDLPKFKEL